MELHQSKLFTPWTDSESGVTSYILTQKVAPVQEGFYFVNDSMSSDGRYLWFYCAFPPSGVAAHGRTLAVLDVEQGEVHHFPETQFSRASPYVDVETGWVYWASGPAIYRRGPEPGDEAELVNALPADLIGNRHVERLATHLTRSADSKAFFCDAAIGVQWVFGSLPVDGGDFQLWHRFDRNHTHAQFNPTDPDLVLFCQEFHNDPVTGLRIRIDDRLWLIRRGEAPRPVLPQPTVLTHEWWDADGEHVWCIKDKEGPWRINIHTHAVEAVDWPQGSWHAHHHRSGKYLVADANVKFYRGCPSTVSFLNRETGRQVRLADNPAMPNLVGQRYHIDPHPRFVGDDQYVVYTTTVRGAVDLSLVPVADLIERTS